MIRINANEQVKRAASDSFYFLSISGVRSEVCLGVLLANGGSECAGASFVDQNLN